MGSNQSSLDDDLVKQFSASKPRFSSLADDIRLFPKTRQALLDLGGGVEYPEMKWERRQSSAWMKKFGPIFASVMAGWAGSIPTEIASVVEKTDLKHKGLDIRILKKKGIKATDVPTLVYFHGGCFAIWSVRDAAYDNYLTRLAALGKCVVVCVDFVSAADEAFPAGLNQCVIATKEVLAGNIVGVPAPSEVVLAGDSAGGNLSISIAMTAKKEGWLPKIAGIYTICPYFDGVVQSPKYPSTYEMNGYFASAGFLTAVVTNVVEKKDRDEWLHHPSLFPMHASTDELRGLPPTKIVTMQLDMIRDIGIAFHYKLLRADVESSLTVVSGGVHEQQLFTEHSPEVTEASIHDLAMYCNYVTRSKK